MTLIETPKAADILCGKDKTFGKHPGNMLYRDLIESKALDYANAIYKLDKMKLTTEIVDTMVSEFGSRFLRPVGPSAFTSNVDGSVRSVSGWEEISLTAARDKTSHALRFCAAHSISVRPLAMVKDKIDGSSPLTKNIEVTPPPSETDQVYASNPVEHSPKDLSRIDEIIQQKLKQIEREKEQQMLLLDDSLGKGAIRKFKKLPIVKTSTSKKPKMVRSAHKPQWLPPAAQSDEATITTLNATAPLPMEQAQKHFFSLSPPLQMAPPPLPPPRHFFSSEPLFPRTVSTDMIVLATAAAAVEAAEARAAALQEESRLEITSANCSNGGC